MKVLCKHDGAAQILIWSPRYHDKRVLIDCRKVKEHNLIQFTKANIDGWHYVSGKTIRKYPKKSNSTILCYAIPMRELEDFEPNKQCEHQF